jgi:hypothetical protein
MAETEEARDWDWDGEYLFLFPIMGAASNTVGGFVEG